MSNYRNVWNKFLKKLLKEGVVSFKTQARIIGDDKEAVLWEKVLKEHIHSLPIVLCHTSMPYLLSKRDFEL